VPNPIGWRSATVTAHSASLSTAWTPTWTLAPCFAQGVAWLASAERAEEVLGMLFGLAALLLPRARAGSLRSGMT
jgi:hypothetical protein